MSKIIAFLVLATSRVLFFYVLLTYHHPQAALLIRARLFSTNAYVLVPCLGNGVKISVCTLSSTVASQPPTLVVGFLLQMPKKTREDNQPQQQLCNLGHSTATVMA